MKKDRRGCFYWLKVFSVFFLYIDLLGVVVDLGEIKQSDHIKTIDFLIGNFNPKQAQEFRLIPQRYTRSRQKIYLRKEVLQAFSKMQKDAYRDGVKLVVISGFRSFRHQKSIWNKKYQERIPTISTVRGRVTDILKYSAFPGVSRHHWGTDIDLNSFENRYFTKTKQGKKVKKWLDQNAHRYGFFLTYTPHHERNRYRTEFWHFTYYPTSSKIMHLFLLEVKPENLNFFKPINQLDLKQIFNNYVVKIDELVLKKMRLDGLLVEIND